MNILKVTTFAALTLVTVMASSTPSFAGTFAQNHPRRAEVLGRDRCINNRINANKGNLSGHYGQLEREDASIRRQEQRDAHMNGGYITKGEQAHLNREENRLNRQITRDE